MLNTILAVAILLFLSGFFSGSESALFSLNRFSLKKMERIYPPSKVRSLKRILKQSHSILVTILIGNMFVNVAVSSISTDTLVNFFQGRGLFISIAVSTFLLLVFGEITPKAIALRAPSKFSLRVCSGLKFFYYLFWPLRKMIIKITDILLEFLGLSRIQEKMFSGEEEIHTLLEIGEKQGVVDSQEKSMIKSVLEFQDTEVSQIMTPRVDIHGVGIDISQNDFLSFLRNIKHSKIPVYEDSLDRIVGIVYAKDVFLNPQIDFRKFIREPIFVPETQKIPELLNIFKEKNEKICIVVDEYGGTAGLVTYEDVLEEIFGEVYDEYETPRKNIVALGENLWRIWGKTSIKEVNQKLNLDLPEEEFDTIAGFVLDIMGEIPKSGQRCSYKNIEITVEKSTAKRIISLLLKVE